MNEILEFTGEAGKFETFSVVKSCFAPQEHKKLVIAEYDPQIILNLSKDYQPGEVHLMDFVVKFSNGQKVSHRVNINNDRYYLFRNQKSCAGCGVIGTRLFLCEDIQQSEALGVRRFHFNLYGQNVDTNDCMKDHFVLMTRDHIVPKSLGGIDSIDNYQTLCWNCNVLKSDCGMNLEQIQSALFPAYRAFKSTVNLNRAKAVMQPLEFWLDKNKKSIPNLDGALEKVQDDRRFGIIEKKERALKNIEEIKVFIRQNQIEAQVKGIVPTERQIKEFIERIR